MKLAAATFIALLSIPTFAEVEKLEATIEWIPISAESPGLWVEGTAPDGFVRLELRVADDTCILASRETVAADGRFSSLLRPERLPSAAYVLDVTTEHMQTRMDLVWGTAEARESYAAVEAATLNEHFERIRGLTHELHREHEKHKSNHDRATWDAWSRQWETRREEMRSALEGFRARRRVLARARDYYRLVSSLCFAETLHDLYAAELGYREGEPGGEDARDWSTALDEQFEAFQEKRTPPTAEEFARWAAELGSESQETRMHAGRCLERAGEAARATLIPLLLSPDVEVAARASELLGRLSR